MEYAVTPKLVDPTNIPQDLSGLQRYADSSLFIDSTLISLNSVRQLVDKDVYSYNFPDDRKLFRLLGT